LRKTTTDDGVDPAGNSDPSKENLITSGSSGVALGALILSARPRIVYPDPTSPVAVPPLTLTVPAFGDVIRVSTGLVLVAPSRP
jgi:hypothetical protein